MIFLLGESDVYSSIPKRRLLTPEEGCGYSKVQHSRIVGGTEAKNGIFEIFINNYRLPF